MKRAIKWIVIVITVLIFLYAFSSSYNSQNIDHLDYVIALCVDTVPDSDDLKVSFEFANLSSFSESSSSSDNEPIINSIVAPSISSAINIMNGYVGKQINLSHCKVIVFSEDFSKRGVLNEVALLAHNIQIRPTTNIVISEGEAVEYIENSVSSLEQVLTKYYSLFPTSSEYTGYTSNIPLGKFYENLLNKDVGAVTILGKELKEVASKEENSPNNGGSDSQQNSESSLNTVSGNSISGGEASQNTTSQDGASDNSVSGNIVSETTTNNKPDYQSIDPQKSIVEGDHGTENMGLAVFKDDKYVGELSTIETLCYSLIQDEVDNFLVTLTSPFDETQKLDFYVDSLSQVDVDLDVSKENPVINVKLNLTAEVLNTLNKPDLSYSEILDKLDEALKQYLSKEFKDYLYKTSKQYQVDINEFYRIARTKF